MSASAELSVLGVAALDYAAKGVPVFPLKPRDKVPLLSKKKGGRGVLDATTDEAKIRYWWTKHPTANIGVATGPVSLLLALDEDPGKNGDASLRALTDAHGDLPRTLVSQTGTGRHYLFGFPPGLEEYRATKKDALGPGLDVRSAGGYIVAPPSIHPNGKEYCFEDAEGFDRALVAEAPAWLVDLIKARCARRDQEDPRAEEKTTGGSSLPPDDPGWPDVAERVRRCRGRLATMPPTVNGDGGNAAFFPPCCECARHALPTQDAVDLLSTFWNEHKTGATGGAGHTRARWNDEEIRRTLASAYARVVADGEWGLAYQMRAIDLAELDFARRLVARAGRDLRHVQNWKTWLVYDESEGRWERDETGHAMRLAKHQALEEREDALAGFREVVRAEMADDVILAKLGALGRKLSFCEKRRLAASLSLAETEPEVALAASAFDDPERTHGILCVANGVVSLSTGELRPHRRDDYFMRRTHVSYDDAASAPRWERFLVETFPDEAVRDYVRRAFGYAITGDPRERALFILVGSGRNGKTTLCETLLHVVGEYGEALPPSILLEGKGGMSHVQDAMLFGIRLGITSETKEGGKLDAERVKRLVGGNTLVAKRLYENPFVFRPSHALFVETNHAPTAEGSAQAVWDRLKFVPFVQRAAKPDTGLRRALMAESPGILKWLVLGAREYLAGGLDEPEAVVDATEEHREAHDKYGFAAFVKEVVPDLRPGFWTTTALHERYTAFADDRGHTPGSVHRFVPAMRDLGLRHGRTNEAKGFYIGSEPVPDLKADGVGPEGGDPSASREPGDDRTGRARRCSACKAELAADRWGGLCFNCYESRRMREARGG